MGGGSESGAPGMYCGGQAALAPLYSSRAQRAAAPRLRVGSSSYGWAMGRLWVGYGPRAMGRLWVASG